MRLLKLIPWMLICGLALALIAPAEAQTPGGRTPGRIMAARVTGTVTATKKDDSAQRVTLENGTVLEQNYIVTTAAGSSVILVFSNGATINLGAESTLSIDEFLQDPFTTGVSVSELAEEPTTSVTKLNLSRGELVGNVKHLKQDQGSSFTVNTPVGAAGIRGTTFRIVFRPDASGQVFFTLSTADGNVLFEAPAAPSVAVETGKEVVVNVEVNVDAATGTVTITAPPAIQAATDMPPATQATIAAAAQQSVEAAAAVIISTTTSTTTDTTKADATKEAEKTTDEKKSDEKKDDTAKTDTSKTDTTKTDNGKSDTTGKTDNSGNPPSDNGGGFTPSTNNNPAPLSPQTNTTPGDGA